CPTGSVTANLTINSGSSPCTISSDMTITGDLTITNSGSLVISSGVTLTVTGTVTLKNSSSITATGATIAATEFSDGSNTNAISGGTYNVGTFTMAGGGSTTINDVIVNSSGAIVLDDVPTVSNSTFNATSSFAINSGTAYTFTNVDIVAGTTANIQDVSCFSCTLNVGDALTLSSGSTTFDNSTINSGTNNVGTNDADALIMNGSAVFTLNNNTQMNVRGSVLNNEWYVDDSDVVITGDFDNQGSEILEVRNNGTFNVKGNFNNTGSGNVSADDGGLIDVEMNFNNTSGSTDVDGGAIVVGGTFSGNTPTGDGGTCNGGSGGCCGSGCSTLPVSLIDFSGRFNSGSVELKWHTASELNNDFFTLEVSNDGVLFTELARVNGHGTINEVSNYSFISTNAISAQGLFYRLSQTDFDGTHVQLKTVYVQFDDFGSEILLYPNPVSRGNKVFLKGIATDGEWTIFSLTGQMVLSGSMKEATVNTTSLERGAYILKAKLPNKTVQERFVVK
ncbi:MAG: T9SS type A sorting domain-containing protein, partial [Bacteroidota bacterium]